MKKIIHFNSKEGLVWRYETAEDRLLEELNKNGLSKKRKNRPRVGSDKIQK